MNWWYSVKVGSLELYVDNGDHTDASPWMDAEKMVDQWGVSLRIKMVRTTLVLTKLR